MVGGSSPGRAARLARDVLHGRVVDLGTLSRSLRLLALFGYASVAAMLAATLFLELSHAGHSGVEFRPEDLHRVLRVPVAAMVASSLSLALGWAFVLTGATDCGRRVFLPVAGIFLVQWLVFVGARGAAAVPLLLGGSLVLVAVAVTHLFSRGSLRWRQYPLIEFSAWLVLMLLVVAESFWAKPPRTAALDMEVALLIPQLLSIPFWVLLGIEAVDGAAALARVCTARLRGLLTEGAYRLVVFLILLARPVAAFVLTFSDDWWWLLDLLVSLLLALWAVGLVLLRRLSVRAASLLLAVSLVLPVLTLGLSQAFRRTDLTTEALSVAGVAGNVVPAALIFVGLAAYDVLNFGVHYANVDGRIMPRGGRLLMYFGVVLLVTAFTLFFLNARVVGTGRPAPSLNLLIDFPFAVGIVVLGLPYLAWMVWKRREELVGDETPHATGGDQPKADG